LNVIEPHRLCLHATSADAAQLIRYGRGLFASNLIMFAIFNADTFIIGAVAGASTLGYYTLALQWGSMVSSLMASIVHFVLFPPLARIHPAPDPLRSASLASLRYFSLFAFLTNVTFLLTANPFLYYALGHESDKWLPALATLKILAIYGIIRVILEP